MLFQKSPAICFNLDQSKNLLSGNELHSSCLIFQHHTFQRQAQNVQIFYTQITKDYKYNSLFIHCWESVSVEVVFNQIQLCIILRTPASFRKTSTVYLSYLTSELLQHITDFSANLFIQISFFLTYFHKYQ